MPNFGQHVPVTGQAPNGCSNTSYGARLTWAQKGKIGSCALHAGPRHYTPRAEGLLIR